MTHKKNTVYSGAILYNPKTRSVLLQLRDEKTKYNPNMWGLFGGSNNDGETPEQCLKRELKEELGADFDTKDMTALCDYQGVARYRYVFVIETTKDTSDFTLAEGADLAWIPLGKVFDYELTPNTMKDLKTFARVKQ